MAHVQLPIASLPLWQILNNVVVRSDVHIEDVPGKGFGLVAGSRLGTGSAPGAEAVAGQALVTVPHGLVLTAETVDEYAKQDRNFCQLLDAVGRHVGSISVRSLILLFLFCLIFSPHVPMCSSSCWSSFSSDAHLLVPTALPCRPWTEYVKFLPADVSLPTLWTDAERALLGGTSLEAALAAKLVLLEHEFDQLRERSSNLPYWHAAFWEDHSFFEAEDSSRQPQLRDWLLADAWYRSRCLELPRSGVAMVPCIDMVNHSAAPSAYYEEGGENRPSASYRRASIDAEGEDVVLLLRPGSVVTPGTEITISYTGSDRAKPASEMLFSYGFIDQASACERMVLPVHPFPDDPLAKAKLHAFGAPPPRLEVERVAAAVGSSRDEKDSIHWTCPFAHLMCVNEEDGLDFRLLQETDGSAQLRVFWQDEDVTCKARDFADLTITHALAPVIQLRVVTMLQEVIDGHMERMQEAAVATSQVDENTAMTGMTSDNDNNENVIAGVRSEVARQARILRDMESSLLSDMLEQFEAERALLLTDVTVLEYLRVTGAPDNDTDDEPMKTEDDEVKPDMGEEDFS